VNVLFLAADDPDPTGLARGRYPAPSWLIWLVCAVVVVGSVAFLVIRARRARSAPRGRP
jgi:hypothetical protein